MAALPTRRPRPPPTTRSPRTRSRGAPPRSLKDGLDLSLRRRALHILDQLGERHPVGRCGERVRRFALEVAVHDALGAELVERGDRRRPLPRSFFLLWLG